jgi:hypothetical protein
VADQRKVNVFGRRATWVLTIASVAGGLGWALAAPGPVDPESFESRINPPLADPGAEATKPPGRSANASPLAGNPLWAVPLSALTVTRERPLFSPSRRPPPAAVVAAPYVAPVEPTQPQEPDHPLLTLVGTVAGETEGIAIFVDQATNDIVRLKTGQDFSGWRLLSIHGREVNFEKDSRSATLVLPPREQQNGPAPDPVPGAALSGDAPPIRDTRDVKPSPTTTTAPLAAAPAAADGGRWNRSMRH